jgi:uncharacterized membrane protein
MKLDDRRGLKAAARAAMAAADYSPRKLILIHTGITVLASLLLYLVTGYMQAQIEQTGGLGGAPIRVMLSTAVSVLQMLFNLVLPFWQIGFLYAAMQIVRGKSAGPDSLREGFRQAWLVLKTQLLLSLFACGLIFACYYAAYTIYLMTPLSKDLMTAMMGTDVDAMMAAMEEALLPICLLMLPPLLVVGLWFSYRIRLVDYVLMDAPGVGAMAVIRRSWKLMKGNFGKLLKLDLSFWWFYALEILLMLVAYADMLLPLIGIQLPWPELVQTYAPLVVYQLLILLLYWWRGSQIQLTYACFYEAALPEDPETV